MVLDSSQLIRMLGFTEAVSNESLLSLSNKYWWVFPWCQVLLLPKEPSIIIQQDIAPCPLFKLKIDIQELAIYRSHKNIVARQAHPASVKIGLVLARLFHFNSLLVRIHLVSSRPGGLAAIWRPRPSGMRHLHSGTNRVIALLIVRLACQLLGDIQLWGSFSIRNKEIDSGLYVCPFNKKSDSSRIA